MSDCVFCDIVDGDASAYRLYETDRMLAFLDIEPLNPGHALVVPKPHHETLTEMEDTLVADTFRSARRVAEAVETAFDPDGLNLLQANGAAAGQEVFHAHVHVLPRYTDDEVEVSWPAGELENPEDVAARIRAAL